MSEFELSREETEEIDAKVGRIHSQFAAIENEMTSLLERVKELEHQAMDERVLAIVKAMARGPICDNDYCGETCLHCHSTNHDEFSSIRHKPECPVLLARAILKEQGTPMNIYKVTYQRVDVEMGKRKYWTTINTHTIAFTLEEAIKEFTWEKTRKVQAEFVCEALLQMGGKHDG